MCAGSIALSLTLTFVAPGDDAVPKTKVLFQNDAFYKNRKEKEQVFEGVLQVVERGGVIGIGRFNPYRLVIKTKAGKADVREIYIGGRKEWLQPYVGATVRIIGKPVELEVVGRVHREIWPARLELVKAAPPGTVKKTTAVKILAQAYFPYFQANPASPRTGKQYVIRSVAELTKLPPWNRLRAAQFVVERKALQDVARLLKKENIDFKKHMLVIISAGVRPTGGYRVTVDSAKVENGKLVILWSEKRPTGIVTQAFTHPAVIALLDRFDGQVVFQRSGGGPIRRPPLPPIRRR